MEPRPIETAPNDGTAFAAYSPGDRWFKAWCNTASGGWSTVEEDGVTFFTDEQFYGRFRGWLPVGDERKTVNINGICVNIPNGYHQVLVGELDAFETDVAVTVRRGENKESIVFCPIPPKPELVDGALYTIYKDGRKCVAKYNGSVFRVERLGVNSYDAYSIKNLDKIGPRIEMPDDKKGGGE